MPLFEYSDERNIPLFEYRDNKNIPLFEYRDIFTEYRIFLLSQFHLNKSNKLYRTSLHTEQSALFFPPFSFSPLSPLPSPLETVKVDEP